MFTTSGGPRPSDGGAASVGASTVSFLLVRDADAGDWRIAAFQNTRAPQG
ncbi:hypothetical protein AB0C76_14565 [Kitasatospora sp. NPDC048722]